MDLATIDIKEVKDKFESLSDEKIRKEIMSIAELIKKEAGQEARQRTLIEQIIVSEGILSVNQSSFSDLEMKDVSELQERLDSLQSQIRAKIKN